MIRGGLLAMGQHNYQVLIAQLVESGDIPTGPCVHVHIEHELWCDTKLVGGLCNCDPTFHVRDLRGVA